MHKRTGEATKNLCMEVAWDKPKKLLSGNYFLVEVNSTTTYLKINIFCC